jgi:HEAT repeat protein
MMKRSSALFLFGLLAVGLFLLLWFRSEPNYGGKQISAWITQLEDPDPTRRQEAQTALQQLGTKGRAWMVRRLNREEPRVDKILRGDRSSGLLTDYDLRRASLATALASLGPAAEPAVPALELAAQHPHWLIAARAQAALMQIRRESSVPLRQSLTNTTDIGSWVRSVCTLHALGSNVEENVSAFLHTLHQDNLSRAFDTVQLLCTNHIDPAISGPILIACLQHKEFGVRANALNAMITQRSWSEAARDAIIQCIADPNPGVRANAMFALNLFPVDKLGSASTNLTQVLNRALNDTDTMVRSFALQFQRKLPHP